MPGFVIPAFSPDPCHHGDYLSSGMHHSSHLARKEGCRLALEESLSTLLLSPLVNELFSQFLYKLLLTCEFSGLMWLHLLHQSFWSLPLCLYISLSLGIWYCIIQATKSYAHSTCSFLGVLHKVWILPHGRSLTCGWTPPHTPCFPTLYLNPLKMSYIFRMVICMDSLVPTGKWYLDNVTACFKCLTSVPRHRTSPTVLCNVLIIWWPWGKMGRIRAYKWHPQTGPPAPYR
jgi:hypothetical protein